MRNVHFSILLSEARAYSLHGHLTLREAKAIANNWADNRGLTRPSEYIVKIALDS